MLFTISATLLAALAFVAGAPHLRNARRAPHRRRAPESRYRARALRTRTELRERFRASIKSDFRPALPNAGWLWLARHALLRPVLYHVYKTLDPRFKTDEIVRHAQLARARVLYVPNHPSKGDPAVLFAVARRLGRTFIIASNREQFRGLYGRLLQRLGAYSLKRGMNDRESFLFTHRTLSSPDSSVAIFAEGGTYSRLEYVAPMQDGVFKLAMNSLDRLGLEGDGTPMYIQPVAIRYAHDAPMSKAINRALDRLERAVGAEYRQDGAPRDRIMGVAERVLTTHERYFHLRSGTFDVRERMGRVIDCHTEEARQLLGGEPFAPGLQQAEKIRELLNRFASVQCADPALDSSYDAYLMTQNFQFTQALRHRLGRLERWIALQPGYLGSADSEEATVDVVQRLELEVFGRIKLQGIKRCDVGLPDPILLNDHLDAYRRDPVATCRSLCLLVEGAIGGNLRSVLQESIS